MKTAAVLPASGIGDALLMMILSHQLKEKGYLVTTFHHSLKELADWFPGHIFSFLSEATPAHLKTFDIVIAENDNSPKIKELINSIRSTLHIFYPTYRAKKHGILHQNDFIFKSYLTMAENIARATATLLQFPHPLILETAVGDGKLTQSFESESVPNETDSDSKPCITLPPRTGVSRLIENGITPPSTLIHRKNEKTVLIHPTSRVKQKNWLASRFIAVAKKLTQIGYHPLFCISPAEENAWECIRKNGLELTAPSSLAKLAALTYESGFVIGNDSLMGHLASNLNLPTLIIANDKERMQLWRPGFKKGELVLPPAWLPNTRLLKLKENHWQYFITPAQVLHRFEKLSRTL